MDCPGAYPGGAHEYLLGSRSALEYVIRPYQVGTDKKSDIVNDPNSWARENDEPRYIIDLVERVTTVSMHPGGRADCSVAEVAYSERLTGATGKSTAVA